MPNQFTQESGLPQISNAELWDAYCEDPSTKKLARRFNCSDRSIRRRLAAIRTEMGLTVNTADVDRAGKMEQLVSSVPLMSAGGGRLKEVSVKLYGVAAKDELAQQIITQGLDSLGATYKIDADAAKSAEIIPYESKLRAYNATGIADSTDERIFIIGDQQMGFWKVRDPEDPKKFSLIPFHDEGAIDIMLKALAVYQPHRVVIVGDFLDFPQLSRFQMEPGYRGTLQASVQEAHDLIKKIRLTVGNDCLIDFIPGNHEARMQRAIVNNNEELANLTRPGEKYALYSMPSLLGFEKQNVTCAAEYPSGEVWLAKRKGLRPGLVVTHADPKRHEMRADAIHGHLVLPELVSVVKFYEDGPVLYKRMCVSGCGNYSDTGDKVRLTRTNTPSGRARMAHAYSFGTVDIDRATGARHMALWFIEDYYVKFRGKTITSSIRPSEAA